MSASKSIAWIDSNLPMRPASDGQGCASSFRICGACRWGIRRASALAAKTMALFSRRPPLAIPAEAIATSSLSQLARRVEASERRSSYPLPRFLPPALDVQQGRHSRTLELALHTRRGERVTEPSGARRLSTGLVRGWCLGLRTLGKGLRAGAGVAAAQQRPWLGWRLGQR